MDALLYWVGIAAVAVYVFTGVLDSGRKQMDLIGALLVGVATALGRVTVPSLATKQQADIACDVLDTGAIPDIEPQPSRRVENVGARRMVQNVAELGCRLRGVN